MITFNTLTDKQEYEIVAVFRTVVYTDSPEAFKFYRFIDAERANEFDDFIAKCKELSFYDTGVTAEYGDKLITLSICEYSLKHVITADRFSIERSTGDVKFEGCDAAELYVKTTTGSVSGTLLTDKVFLTDTKTGSVDVPGTVTGGRCEIRTNTGDIKVKIG